MVLSGFLYANETSPPFWGNVGKKYMYHLGVLHQSFRSWFQVFQLPYKHGFFFRTHGFDYEVI
jgi:hypothetical protein